MTSKSRSLFLPLVLPIQTHGPGPTMVPDMSDVPGMDHHEAGPA